jgi:hypothetical protein
MKNSNQLLSLVSKEALTTEEALKELKQDWHLLLPSTRAARVDQVAKRGLKQRAIARGIGVDDKTVRQYRKVHLLPDAQKLAIDRGAPIAPLLAAKQTEAIRISMITRTPQSTTEFMSSSGLLELLRDFAQQVPELYLTKVIRETRNQLRLCSNPQSFPGLTPQTVITKTKPEPQEENGFGLVNFWSQWIKEWTLALIPDRAFVDDMLEILLQESLTLRLAS